LPIIEDDPEANGKERRELVWIIGKEGGGGLTSDEKNYSREERVMKTFFNYRKIRRQQSRTNQISTEKRREDYDWIDQLKSKYISITIVHTYLFSFSTELFLFGKMGERNDHLLVG
jgi:hypothetical protein